MFEPEPTDKAAHVATAVDITPPSDDQSGSLSMASVVPPLTSPQTCYFIAQYSAHLIAPRKAYLSAVTGPLRIVPRIDLSSRNAGSGRQKVREMLERERARSMLESSTGDDDPFAGLDDSPLVTEEEVDEAVRRLQRRQKAEMALVREYYDSVYPEGPLGQLRRLLATDYWTTGNRWLAVARDQRGRPVRYGWLPALEMRFRYQELKPVMFRRVVRVGLSGLKTIEYPRYPRLIVQLRGGSIVRYYREWGDPRLVSAKDGRVYTEEQWRAEDARRRREGNEPLRLATEVLHASEDYPAAWPYGQPAWAPARMKIESATKSDQVVDQHWEKPHPRKMLVVAGTGPGAAEQTAGEIEQKAGGVRSYGDLLVVDGLRPDPDMMSTNPTAAGGAAKFEVVDLGNGIADDMFVGLDTWTESSIGSATSTPPLMRGRDRDVNRASAREQARGYEMQVARPARAMLWDDEQNEIVLPELGVCTVEVHTLPAQVQTDDETNEQLLKAVETGVLMPNDVRSHLVLPGEHGPLEPSPRHPWTETPAEYVALFKDGLVDFGASGDTEARPDDEAISDG